MKLPQLSPILCGWFFPSCPPNRQNNIPSKIVKKKQGLGSSWGRGEDRLEGRFVNQGRDHSLHNHASQYRRESETVLGQFVSYPDGLTHQNTFGIVRNSDGSSVVEQPPQLPDSVLRGHFTQADIPSGTETRQQNLNQQEDEEYPYQQQTFQDHGQQSFQPPN